jgi:hypothetical protein
MERRSEVLVVRVFDRAEQLEDVVQMLVERVVQTSLVRRGRPTVEAAEASLVDMHWLAVVQEGRTAGKVLAVVVQIQV